jgi:hypothetical protein
MLNFLISDSYKFKITDKLVYLWGEKGKRYTATDRHAATIPAAAG